MMAMYATGELAKDRKLVSHYGALPAAGQDIDRRGRWSNYTDPGNKMYSKIYDLLVYTGNNLMNLTPKIAVIYSQETKGDILEACLGTFAFCQDRYSMDSEWQHEPHQLSWQVPAQACAIRLMIVAAFTMDVVKAFSPSNIKELLPDDPEEFVALLSRRSDALERGEVDRVRSLRGSKKNYTRNNERYLQRKGKGLPLGKGKGKGQGKGTKGKD